MLLCCYDSGWTISDLSDVANVIIALVNIALAYYIFFYQKQKDQESKIESSRLQEQNIRLQWFKELVIQPHLSDINTFYTELHTLEGKIMTVTLSEDQKIDLIGFVKLKQVELRKVFIDVLRGVNPQLYLDAIKNIDDLTDAITIAIFNDGLNLTHKPTYEIEIGSKITYSRNDLISKVYNYKGI